MLHPHLLEVYFYPTKKRYGANGDGGYVTCHLPVKYDCYISAGIAEDESFTRDFLSDYCISPENTYAFDGTIDEYPRKFNKNIQFIRKNIGSEDNQHQTNLQSVIQKYQNIFLCMDIEGSEFSWFLSLNRDSLCRFQQIVVELHGLNDDSWGCSYADKVKCLEKLNGTHYIMHAHGNNVTKSWNNPRCQIPDLIELTYVRKDCFVKEPKQNNLMLPSELDFPNLPDYEDHNLNHYPFVTSNAHM